MAEEAKHPVRTTEKTLALIELLRRRDGGRVTELADELDVGKSAVHNHLSTLAAHGYVVRDDETYRLGLKFLELGGYTRDRLPLYEVAEPEVERIAAETGERANLMTEEAGEGVYLYRSKGERAVDLDTYTGMRVPLHTTALGTAILAYTPRERVAAILDRHGLAESTDNTIADRDALFDRLDAVCERGVALDDEERLEGLRCVAAPITVDGTALGAISVSAPTSRMGSERFEREIPDVVRGAANVIELSVKYA